ncbi:MAG: phenylacetate-CoA oxygenase subunit PaaI [Pelagimonas sp.]|jgi:1,2-phenylacetyl-CoA epoxidase catalytic subunit|nr:phenylacetate-CoA oxygenase subunit PaaI [Pelagimonas sp.]
MSEEMSIESYLEKGGVLTNPTNVPARYRAELMKLMATFVDSELAGAAGFADVINTGPGIKERIAAAKIVLEKTDNADRVLKIMGQFGVDEAKYANHHPWTARLDRDADIGATRSEQDMRLAVFNYPLDGWADSVVMNLLMGRAVAVQLAEFSMVSYQPLAEAFRAIAPIEARHAELAAEGLTKLAVTEDKAALEASVAYWWPRVAASFGADVSAKAETLKKYGLRKTSNSELKSRWESETKAILQDLGLSAAD